MSLSDTSIHMLNTSRDGDSITDLHTLIQCLTILLMKKFFFLSNQNFPWHSFGVVLSCLFFITLPPGKTTSALLAGTTSLVGLVTSSVVLLWTSSSTSMSFMYWGPYNWTHDASWSSWVPLSGRCPYPGGHTISDTSHNALMHLIHWPFWQCSGSCSASCWPASPSFFTKQLYIYS